MKTTFENHSNSEIGSENRGAGDHRRAKVYDDVCCAALAKFNEKAAAVYRNCCEGCEYRAKGLCPGVLGDPALLEEQDREANATTVSLRKLLTDLYRLIGYMKKVKESGLFDRLGNVLRNAAQLSKKRKNESILDQLLASLNKLEAKNEEDLEEDMDWPDVDSVLPIPDGYVDIKELLLENLKLIDSQMRAEGYPGMSPGIMKSWVSVAIVKIFEEALRMFDDWAELCCETGKVVSFREVFA
ncbi:MAG TPA: hypothetical protein GXX77_08400 [Candidatus Cloacimonetes bacterium]|nr:hypothetical protein [Candidatus Cloacimonadota bacterium]